MKQATLIATVQAKFELLRPLMTERLRRQWAAVEAQTLGRGGTAVVAGYTVVVHHTGLSRTTLWAGRKELQERADHPEHDLSPERVRRPGAGRPVQQTIDPALLRDLEALVEPTTRGDPQSPLRWTCKSTRKLAAELRRRGHAVSHQTVAVLLHDLGYSLQANRKTQEGASHPDRDAQFRHINTRTRACQRRGQPVVSVDSKKRESIGNFKNPGREWQPVGSPEEVRTKDFPDKELGKVTPSGVYDVTLNEGWVSVGIDHNTAQFATETIRRWWQEMGQPAYPEAEELLILADAGGSNSSRGRLWKVSLQELADRIGLRIAVCHFPPGTSKWNKIDHRMFAHITQNWRGRPLRSRALVVSLIGNTTTKAGLHIEAALDGNTYETGIEVSDEELAAVQLHKDKFHGDWNYTIVPH
jgi:hypothetical protein